MIWVIGDCFVDKYWLGTCDRVSPEAPIPVVKITGESIREGGAANVAENIKHLGGLVRLQDSGGCRPTKNRLMVGDYQLARWDEFDVCQEYASVDFLDEQQDADLVIADYGKGSISFKVIGLLSHKVMGRKVYVDTKDDPLKFECLAGAAKLTMFPNDGEYRKFHNQYLDISEWGSVVWKRGAEGIALVENRHAVEAYPAETKVPISVVGAGDTVMAAYATAESEGSENPLKLANHAAGIVVGRRFTSVLTREEWLGS